MTTFAELGLDPRILTAISEQGYEYPMPVQEAVIRQAGSTRDLIALAQTGTGKTAAYALPLIQQLASETSDSQSRTPRALVLAPTRELCLQITDDIQGYSRHIPHLHILPVYGGTNIEPQIKALRRHIDIIVATPGRLIDLTRRHAADLSGIQTLILDEADEMLSMGFQDELNAILQSIPPTRRTLLFSATMSQEIDHIARQYLRDPLEIQVGSRNEGAEHVTHLYYMVRSQDKYHALKRIVDYYPRIYAIIFCRTRMETQEIADKLIRDGYNADALHGELSQQQRDLTMQKFRQHRTQLLVATDVAARGLDVDDLTHVINYGLPDDTENYTHRSGRTGRAGNKGISISIVHSREKGKIRTIGKTIQKPFLHSTLPSGPEICKKQLYRVIDDIERVTVMEDEISDIMPEVRRRWEWLDKDELIKRIVSREFGRFLSYYADAPEIQEVPDTPAAATPSRRRRGNSPEPGYTRLFINIGKADGYRASEIMGLINRATSTGRGRTSTPVHVGKIDIMKSFSFIEVPDTQSHALIKAFRHGITVRGRSIVLDIADQTAQGSTAAKRHTAKPRTGRSDTPVQPARKHYSREEWMQFLNPDMALLKGEKPDFTEEGWARRKRKK